MRLELIEDGRSVFSAESCAAHENGYVWYNNGAVFSMRADADAVRAELVTTGGMEMLKDKDAQAQDVIEKIRYCARGRCFASGRGERTAS